MLLEGFMISGTGFLLRTAWSSSTYRTVVPETCCTFASHAGGGFGAAVEGSRHWLQVG